MKLADIFKAKEEYRKVLAKLPFEEKIKIVGKLKLRVKEIKSKVNDTISLTR